MEDFLAGDEHYEQVRALPPRGGGPGGSPGLGTGPGHAAGRPGRHRSERPDRHWPLQGVTPLPTAAPLPARWGPACPPCCTHCSCPCTPPPHRRRVPQVEHLGGGAFSTVVRARHKATGEVFAVKLIERGSLVRGDRGARSVAGAPALAGAGSVGTDHMLHGVLMMRGAPPAAPDCRSPAAASM